MPDPGKHELMTCAWPGQADNRQEDSRLSLLPSVYVTSLRHTHIVVRLEVLIFFVKEPEVRLLAQQTLFLIDYPLSPCRASTWPAPAVLALKCAHRKAQRREQPNLPVNI